MLLFDLLEGLSTQKHSQGNLRRFFCLNGRVRDLTTTHGDLPSGNQTWYLKIPYNYMDVLLRTSTVYRCKIVHCHVRLLQGQHLEFVRTWMAPSSCSCQFFFQGFPVKCQCEFAFWCPEGKALPCHHDKGEAQYFPKHDETWQLDTAPYKRDVGSACQWGRYSWAMSDYRRVSPVCVNLCKTTSVPGSSMKPCSLLKIGQGYLQSFQP